MRAGVIGNTCASGAQIRGSSPWPAVRSQDPLLSGSFSSFWGAVPSDRGANIRSVTGSRSTIDWAAVQAYYDAGQTLAECKERFGFSNGSWDRARLRGELKTRGAWRMEGRPRHQASGRAPVQRGPHEFRGRSDPRDLDADRQLPRQKARDTTGQAIREQGGLGEGPGGARPRNVCAAVREGIWIPQGLMAQGRPTRRDPASFAPDSHRGIASSRPAHRPRPPEAASVHGGFEGDQV